VRTPSGFPYPVIKAHSARWPVKAHPATSEAAERGAWSLRARGKAEGRDGGAQRSENSMADVTESGSERRRRIVFLQTTFATAPAESVQFLRRRLNRFGPRVDDLRR
jgi:hypothetical protein